MFHAREALKALEAQQADFTGFDRFVQASLEEFGAALRRYFTTPAEEILRRLEDTFGPGALPTCEHAAAGPEGVLRFACSWANHREARQWALERIAGITTLAVDGSQIFPSHDYALPIAAVQAGWYENPHDPARPYTKDVRMRIVPPAELALHHGDGTLAEWRVHARRFELEIATMLERIRQWNGAYAHERPPVIFLDGALVLTFANSLPDGRIYTNAVLSLLRASEEHRVPVVAYIDTSLARDVAKMLGQLYDLTVPEGISDALLFHGLGMRWGDRSEAFVCRRDDTLRVYLDDEGRDFSRSICFVYLQATAELPPVRIEFPRWVLDAGLLDYVLDVVRCEIIVGTGYPYCLEAADEAAVLGAQDRERFFRLFEDFARRHGIPIQLAAKPASKRRRR